jgi:NADP-dependent 3-hydroxy acid dehydrogenase YdfG
MTSSSMQAEDGRAQTGTQRVAVVTGASSGIGRAVATLFVEKLGVPVVAGGRSARRLNELAAHLADRPGMVVPAPGDIIDPGNVEFLLTTAERKFRPADIFVLSAGRGLSGTILNSDQTLWRELVETNVIAALEQLRVCGAEFRKQAEADQGNRVRDIVVIGSTVGRHVSAANPVYGSTKFALHSITEALRQEICGLNIRVTLIEPGFVRSGFQESAGYDMEWFESLAKEYGPLLRPEDIADIVGYVVTRPPHVHLDDIRVRPTRQKP